MQTHVGFLFRKSLGETKPAYSVASALAKHGNRQGDFVTPASWVGGLIGLADCQAQLRVFTESTFRGRWPRVPSAEMNEAPAFSVCSPGPGEAPTHLPSLVFGGKQDLNKNKFSFCIN